ncbi:cysteine rich repeat-containing protein [Bradyrhizobium tropiciagri]|uniref:cysteine rich repeat-containing protein n=1 Tax=Bradyrhizobium tropiciagri TaxID=312253 RepID=UPI00067C7226|nr:hypothetical protein [Bradyrhizobium tropiciagri]
MSRKLVLAASVAAFAAPSLTALAIVLTSLSGSAARAQDDTTLSHCLVDAERMCPGVTPGGGTMIECLKQHPDDVSVGCAKALKAVKAKMGK